MATDFIPEHELTDAKLVELAQSGDPDAWRQLSERLISVVWRATRARVSNRVAAEEITSETMLAVVRNLHSLEPGTCQLHGWVRRIVHNKVVDWFRKQNRHSRALELLQPTADQWTCEQPADRTLLDEHRVLINSILESMRDDYRHALELKYLDELSVQEIAQRLGESEKTVESLLYRSRRDFRKRYEQARLREAKPLH